MTQISLRGTMLIAVSALALTACGSKSSDTDALTAANATIASKSATIVEKDATIASKNATIAEKDALIAAKQASIDAANVTIAQKQAALDAANATIAARNATIAANNDEIAAKAATISSLQSEVADLEAQIITLKATKTSLEADKAALQADKALLQGQVADLQAQVKDYNKTAFNANRDKTLVADGGYKRGVGSIETGATAGAVNAARSGLGTAQSDLSAKQDAAAAALTAKNDAQAAYDEADNFVIDPDYVGLSLATYYADLKSDAEFYAEILDLDLTDSGVQGQLVDTVAFANAVTALNNALTSAQNNLTSANNDVTSATTAVANAQTALENAIRKYHSDRRPQQAGELTLYQADGSEVLASGAMVYKQSLDDALQPGNLLQEAGRLTALFLVDENGDPTNVLVFEASMVGASSEDNPFTLPVGAATFASTSMVAAFAQLEGAENGINTYRLEGDTNAGSLTLNFDTNTGRLVVVGLENQGSDNEDFSVNADLTFDPQTGTFTADLISQAYTSKTTGDAELASGKINGALSAVADAFTAYIDTTDKTGINDVDVKIMTRIVGTGAVTLAPTP